jgi:hypothetical protein
MGLVGGSLKTQSVPTQNVAVASGGLIVSVGAGPQALDINKTISRHTAAPFREKLTIFAILAPIILLNGKK